MRKQTLALIIPGHNEELVLAKTIRSAINAGLDARHIYMVDDNSSDNTRAIAIGILGKKNVHTVTRSGKGLAVQKAARHFKLVEKYRWIHIADADGEFDRRYFTEFRKNLRVKYAAATGYLKSMEAPTAIRAYRVYEYTLGMKITRRVQRIFNVMPIIPGPSSCFRSDVFAKLNFNNKSVTEDCDVTVQLYRNNLGDIQFIPTAIAYTQDPLKFSDYMTQITRWGRGYMQVSKRHRLGTRLSRVDLYTSYLLALNIFLFVTYFIIVPTIAVAQRSLLLPEMIFISDVIAFLFLTATVSYITKTPGIMVAFPYLYVYRWVSFLTSIRCLIEVYVLGMHKTTEGKWGTENRRYVVKT